MGHRPTCGPSLTDTSLYDAWLYVFWPSEHTTCNKCCFGSFLETCQYFTSEFRHQHMAPPAPITIPPAQTHTQTQTQWRLWRLRGRWLVKKRRIRIRRCVFTVSASGRADHDGSAAQRGITGATQRAVIKIARTLHGECVRGCVHWTGQHRVLCCT